MIDPSINEPVAAEVIRGDDVPQLPSDLADGGLRTAVNSCRRGLTVWFTGLSGAGKTTLCRATATELLKLGLSVEIIDGDVIRKHLCKGLGFTRDDRNENIYRIAFVANLLTRNGVIVLVSAISPYRDARDEARRTIGAFTEVYVKASLEVCEARDAKGLYKKARAGEIKAFTGIDDPYEQPLKPEIICDTEEESVRESTTKIIAYLRRYRAGVLKGEKFGFGCDPG